MTYGNPGDERSSRNARREAAREKARELREQHRKKEKRSRYLLQGGVVVAALAIVAVVALVITLGVRPESPGPLNMQSDGILIGKDFLAERTPAIQPGDLPVPNERDEKSDVVAIQLYVDYLCPFCGAFEKANGEQIATWVESGAATLEIHPIAILDSGSEGTKYSSRTVNAAACVANYSPDSFFAFNALLFSNQPKENTPGLSDSEIIALTKKAEVSAASTIATCITEQKFTTWAADAKARALTGPIAGSNIEKVTETPTVLVNGLRFTGAPNDSVAFTAFVTQALGTTFNEKTTATPTPTPVP